MRYKMQHKLFSIGNDYFIKDSNDNDVFFVDGKAFTFGSKLSFQDLSGNELAYIKQVMLKLRPTYEIFRSDRLFARIEKKFAIFKSNYTVDIPGPNDYTVEGDFFAHEYSFIRKGREVAHASKKFFSLRGIYGIDIDDDEDQITILATAVVIDLIKSKSRRNSAAN